MKPSMTNTEKAIVIRKLQASVNKLKGTVLEKGVLIRELNAVNVRLASELTQSHRVTKVWMITAFAMIIMGAVSGCAWLA